jgi:hypothetical protein
MKFLANLHIQSAPTHDSLPGKDNPHELAETSTHSAGPSKVAIGKSEITCRETPVGLTRCRIA